jgi:hypothetical protein
LGHDKAQSLTVLKAISRNIDRKSAGGKRHRIAYNNVRANTAIFVTHNFFSFLKCGGMTRRTNFKPCG